MPPQNSKHYQVPFRNDANFVNHPDAADIKIQPKSPKFLLDMRYFCNFSLVSLGIHPHSRRCAERTRQGEGRWSRPPKAALERSYSIENSSSANRILRPRRKKNSWPNPWNQRMIQYNTHYDNAPPSPPHQNHPTQKHPFPHPASPPQIIIRQRNKSTTRQVVSPPSWVNS